MVYCQQQIRQRFLQIPQQLFLCLIDAPVTNFLTPTMQYIHVIMQIFAAVLGFFDANIFLQGH